MTTQQAKEILDKIVGQVFGYQNPFTLEEFIQKYAFDVRLPSQVNDATTGETTWASSTNPTKYLSMKNAHEGLAGRDVVTGGLGGDFMRPPRQFNSLQEVLQAWSEINFTTTERQIESLNVSESDCVYNSENVYRSQDVNQSKNILFSDSIQPGCEYIAAGQRSVRSNFCIRLDDSQNCSNSFSVSWSNKVTNSLFINDCFDLSDCMFCYNIASKRFCIANMQYEEAEYKRIRDQVVRWILAN